mmetsp:Transcript_32350/g.74506  ORF Transcript_32350/g.74506 Transcript_32350/m.74506 type:complete len:712 (+) Transcript_32350:462-2597(+)
MNSKRKETGGGDSSRKENHGIRTEESPKEAKVSSGNRKSIENKSSVTKNSHHEKKIEDENHTSEHNPSMEGYHTLEHNPSVKRYGIDPNTKEATAKVVNSRRATHASFKQKESSPPWPKKGSQESSALDNINEIESKFSFKEKSESVLSLSAATKSPPWGGSKKIQNGNLAKFKALEEISAMNSLIDQRNPEEDIRKNTLKEVNEIQQIPYSRDLSTIDRHRREEIGPDDEVYIDLMNSKSSEDKLDKLKRVKFAGDQSSESSFKEERFRIIFGDKSVPTLSSHNLADDLTSQTGSKISTIGDSLSKSIESQKGIRTQVVLNVLGETPEIPSRSNDIYNEQRVAAQTDLNPISRRSDKKDEKKLSKQKELQENPWKKSEKKMQGKLKGQKYDKQTVSEKEMVMKPKLFMEEMFEPSGDFSGGIHLSEIPFITEKASPWATRKRGKFFAKKTGSAVKDILVCDSNESLETIETMKSEISGLTNPTYSINTSKHMTSKKELDSDEISGEFSILTLNDGTKIMLPKSDGDDERSSDSDSCIYSVITLPDGTQMFLPSQYSKGYEKRGKIMGKVTVNLAALDKMSCTKADPPLNECGGGHIEERSLFSDKSVTSKSMRSKSPSGILRESSYKERDHKYKHKYKVEKPVKQLANPGLNGSMNSLAAVSSPSQHCSKQAILDQINENMIRNKDELQIDKNENLLLYTTSSECSSNKV